MQVAKEAKLGDYYLTSSQIKSVGVYKKLELTVECFNTIIERIKLNPIFQQYTTFERYDNHLICLQSTEGEILDQESLQRSRRFKVGDLKIEFEVVYSPRISMLSQQTQDTQTGRFFLRPFNPFKQ